MKKGFAVIEIVAIAAVLIFLCVFTVPKFMSLVHKAQEGSTKHQLMRVRSAIAAYYGENQGMYPTDDLSCLVPRYLEEIPLARIPGYAPSSHVSIGNFETAFTKTGGWAYVNDPADPRFGDFFVNSEKEDSYGKMWHTH
ncbi:type II secretion system protein [Candidatus Avelusimicrobium luingense]|uniref:type II secretion system protein n=1 Tax=Candidatus Avelusimicrobium luingense TaxID=3416211 RepID=UPI003D1486AE